MTAFGSKADIQMAEIAKFGLPLSAIAVTQKKPKAHRVQRQLSDNGSGAEILPSMNFSTKVTNVKYVTERRLIAT